MSEVSFGVCGLAVMGRNLALNAAGKGIPTAVWNRDGGRVAAELAASAPALPLRPARELASFVAALPRPRFVYLLIKAGEPIDRHLDALLPLLGPGDVVADGGNSQWRDTLRRRDRARAAGVDFIGVGTSGGEEGARRGPALMAGSEPAVYLRVRGVLERIAARSSHGPCAGRVGGDGAGHFVKMVHNGIEYAEMQLLAEAFDLLARGAGEAQPAIAAFFEEAAAGPLGGFLVEITARILRVRDPETGRPLLELVDDRAADKGTGRWTLESALELGVPVPTLGAAYEARRVSGLDSVRAHLAAGARDPAAHDRAIRPLLVPALITARLAAFVQGLQIFAAARASGELEIDRTEALRTWTGGCILRSRLLEEILPASGRSPEAANLAVDPRIRALLLEGLPPLRELVSRAAVQAVPVPALGSALAYLEMLRSVRLPQALIQAQRDAFGAHGYRRIDQAQAGLRHDDWLGAGP
jgi:6-phosphogluconate dehydrogenase